MDVWVEGSDKRKPTNGPVLKSFYDNETDQWVGPDDKCEAFAGNFFNANSL